RGGRRTVRDAVKGDPPRAERDRRRAENRPPTSSQELLKGSVELAGETGIRVNWKVLGISSAIILAFSVWAITATSGASSTMRSVVLWIATNLGWFYILTVTIVIIFVAWVAFSKEGGVRLGPDHSRPQYRLVTWVAMLFAAGV